jgi:hypothetical protein
MADLSGAGLSYDPRVLGRKCAGSFSEFDLVNRCVRIVTANVCIALNSDRIADIQKPPLHSGHKRKWGVLFDFGVAPFK